MSRLRFEQAAQRLFEAHERREPFLPLPPELTPHTSEAAYAIQDAFVALRAQKRGAIAGYKIALASAAMRRFVGVDHPQAGVIFESTVQRTPAAVRAADYLRLIVEFEIAVQMAAGTMTPAEVGQAIRVHVGDGDARLAADGG
jgi:2-keto-4-pentenoate hydratase